MARKLLPNTHLAFRFKLSKFCEDESDSQLAEIFVSTKLDK